jgi:hypothetical protein
MAAEARTGIYTIKSNVNKLVLFVLSVARYAVENFSYPDAKIQPIELACPLTKCVAKRSKGRLIVNAHQILRSAKI